MNSDELKKFEAFFEDSFKDGVYKRELRLSDEEVEIIKERYPKANFKKCTTCNSDTDKKRWWEVAFQK